MGITRLKSFLYWFFTLSLRFKSYKYDKNGVNTSDITFPLALHIVSEIHILYIRQCDR